MPKDKNWIQKATANNKGALRKELGAKKGQPIPVKKLDAAIKKGGKIAKRAQLAKTLRKLK